MKRLFPPIITLLLTLSLCLPAQAAFSFQEDRVISTTSSTETSGKEDSPEKQTASEKSSVKGTGSETTAASGNTKPSEPETSLKESSDTEPIGDTSSYYGLDELGSGPEIVAESAIIMDADTGAVLYTKDADSKQYPASITKVMTALLAIENCSMDDVITFSDTAVNGIEAGSSTAGINVGAKLTVRDTLYALMLVSANEAGAAIAEHISGSNEAFAKLMTSRAKELGCTGTNFKNPHGLPDEEHYTTAHDMGLILKQAMKYEDFRTISSTNSYTLEKSDTLTNTLELWNHAKILRESSDYYYEYIEGAKTGYTRAALNTLVTFAKKDNVELLCVILKDYGADNSYYDTAKLFTWGFEQVKVIQPLNTFDLNEALSGCSSIDSGKLNSLKRLNCTFPSDYTILTNKDFDDSALSTSFLYDEDTSSGRIGYVTVSSGDTIIGKAPVSYDITTDTGKNYQNGKESDDDLETAPADENKLTPRKLLLIIIRIIIILIIFFVFVNMIRRRRAEKRRQRRIQERRKRRSSSGMRNPQPKASGKNSSSTRRSGTPQKKRRSSRKK